MKKKCYLCRTFSRIKPRKTKKTGKNFLIYNFELQELTAMETPKKKKDESPENAPVNEFPVMKIEWSKEVIKEVFYLWYCRFCKKRSEASLYEFSELLLGMETEFCFDFKDKYSDADLMRVGYFLGLNLQQQKKAFEPYRRANGKKSDLSSGLRPKKDDFFKGSDIAQELRELLEKNGIFYLHPEETKEDIERRIRKENSLIMSSKHKIVCLQEEMEYRKEKIESLMKIKEKIKK